MILSIIITILVGALVGWLAGLLMKSKHGFWLNCLLGIIGAILGDAIATRVLHIGGGFVVELIIAILGTCLVIAIVRLIMGKKF
ncbi:MAG: GlsB/YeaQ/YmgE family stress response membrane protein [Spirochaetaceae bacterium]|nr:GlsB/YeaQ/YmgE family stress response membrane protein [Spirochaetaceae bacterium]